jgi:hypothetical protein
MGNRELVIGRIILLPASVHPLNPLQNPLPNFLLPSVKSVTESVAELPSSLQTEVIHASS